MSSTFDRRAKTGDRYRKPAGVSKQKTGFRVGRALPDGPQLRRVQQIKRGLIENAKLRKQYAKVKGKGPSGANDIPLGEAGVSYPSTNEEQSTSQPLEDVSEVEWSDEDDGDERKVKRRAAAHEEDDAPSIEDQSRAGRIRRRKPQPFQRQVREAERRRREIEERIEARKQADQERQQKIEERERFRKAMAKARTGGKNGQRKLGRESAVLLEKVQRMVGN
jgi:hypothetical protein